MKHNKLVFYKRVVDPYTSRSFPYGFKKLEWNPLGQSILNDLMASYNDDVVSTDSV